MSRSKGISGILMVSPSFRTVRRGLSLMFVDVLRICLFDCPLVGIGELVGDAFGDRSIDIVARRTTARPTAVCSNRGERVVPATASDRRTRALSFTFLLVDRLITLIGSCAARPTAVTTLTTSLVVFVRGYRVSTIYNRRRQPE
jgi:hypothetical protein